MENNQVHEAFNLLYKIARKLPVTGDDGDIRDKAARLLHFAIVKHYPAEQEPGTDNGDTNPNLKAVSDA